MKRKRVKREKKKKAKGIMVRLFEEKGGADIETIMGDLRIRGFFVEEKEKEEHHLEITVSQKRIEEVEKILMSYGCCRMSPEM